MLQLIQEDRPDLGSSFRSKFPQVSVNMPYDIMATFKFELDENVEASLQVWVVEGGKILQRVTTTNNKLSSYTLPRMRRQYLRKPQLCVIWAAHGRRTSSTPKTSEHLLFHTLALREYNNPGARCPANGRSEPYNHTY
ncbi:hypothetical protein PMIN02_013140 [Paraphaeosphaeria minitans]